MAATNYINKPKQHIVHFLKKATSDRNSVQYSELVNYLLKMFVDADKNKDGTVDVEEFSGLIDTAAFTPREYGFAPQDAEMYKTKEAKEEARYDRNEA